MIEGGDFYEWTDSRDGKKRISRICKVCTRRRARKRYAKAMADPYLAAHERELGRKRHARALERKPGENAERCRRYRERLKRERPDEYARMLEDARIRTKLRKMDAGATIRVANGNWVGKGASVFLDPDPIKRLAATLTVERDDERLTRAVYRVLHESTTRVELSTVELIALHAGVFAHEIYPELSA